MRLIRLGRYRKILSAIVNFLTPVFSFRGRITVAVSLISLTLVTGLKQLGGFQRFELAGFDYFTRLSPASLDSRLVIIGITEADLQQYGWPLSDQTIADLLSIVQRHHPKVVGLDIYRNFPHEPGTAQLTEQLNRDNVIAIMNVGSRSAADQVPPPPTVPWERVGFNDLIVDPDGSLRRTLLFVNAPEKPYFSFALRVATQYVDPVNAAANILSPDPTSLVLGEGTIPRLQRGGGGYQRIDARGYQTLLRYRSAHSPGQTLTAQQILTGDFEGESLRGKVVLIGSVARSLRDEFHTPYLAGSGEKFAMPGVTVHGHITSQLLDIAAGNAAIYRFLPAWGEFAWLIMWIGLVSTVAWSVKRSEGVLLGGVGLGALSFGISFVSFSYLIWLPTVEPIVGILLATGLVVGQRAIYQQTHDALTGLPSRDLFLAYIQRAIAQPSREGITVAFLDVNRFQVINKSLGHSAGDGVLVTIAERLVATLGDQTKLARMGGDEFAILFPHSRQSQINACLEAMRAALSKPLILQNHRLAISASVGLAITQRQSAQSPAGLLRDAHTAMYRAKAMNEFRHQVFSSDMREDALSRLDLESDLLAAFDNQEFFLNYQPIVALKTGRLKGFEALVRWNSGEKGIISPADFIPVVEETGLILPLGEWIFREACCQLSKWQAQFPDQDLKISINLSAQQFKQDNLFSKIELILKEFRLAGHFIQIEITESTIIEDSQAAYELMMRLKQLGIQIAIDDFGTGYSSLSYLHRFPSDALKVDRSFVSRMENSTEDYEIVQTIVTLGQKLNMHLVAEGIANQKQLALLREAGCEYGQGYFFSKPLSVADASEAIAHQAQLPHGLYP
ncbi:MAG: EAL domain-containing protein [Leptolyngbya sp. RL_3_1]|nr:EAL domain-containing protein [Leptolyngbya sp. RL_3_1]